MYNKYVYTKNEERLTEILRRIIWFLYAAIVFIEISISFVLYSEGLIYGSLSAYVIRYVIIPLGLSLLIIIIGRIVASKKHSHITSHRVYITVITIMFGTVVFIHNVFLVAFFIFAIPIFLTVIFQDTKLLHLITGMSIFFVIVTAIYCYAFAHEDISIVSQFYLPSIIITIIVLIACDFIARTSIELLVSKNDALIAAIADAQAANTSKSVFLSNMSHEIRTPINAILGMDEMILRESQEVSTKEYALDIQTSGKTLLGLVNDILDVSKIEAGKLELIVVEYDLSTMIGDLSNLIATRAADKGLSFMIEANPDIPRTLVGDEVRVKQIILNLLTNAVKYTETGSVKLKFDYRKEDDRRLSLLVSVSDTGQGIKPEDIEKLFTPFERINEANNRNIEGTGLGMNITKSLLAMMDSELSIDSEWQKGSTFSFEVIQEVKNWNNKIGEINSSSSRSRLGLLPKYKVRFTAPDAKILIVDDVKMNLKVIQSLIKKTQIQVDTATSGEECLELTKQNKYDILFIDHMMPHMDGMETFEKIVADDSNINKNSPAVALTANAISGSREFYINSGFTEYLSKPVDPIKLEKLLEDMLPKELIIKSE